mmetsp:Transcript_31576/g.71765  ORF Transcript_31576/g.71765 Transcript_31576/m.71765 type:complete len:223 (+) Transcript_31576:461-1129(+)
MLDALPRRGAAEVEVVNGLQDLPKVQGQLAVLLPRLVHLELQLITGPLHLVEIARQGRYPVGEGQGFHLLLFPVVLELVAELLCPLVGLALVLQQLPVGALKRLVAGHEVLDLGVVVAVVLHLLQELLVLLVPLDLIVELGGALLALHELPLELPYLLVLLLDLGLLLCGTGVGSSPLCLVVLQELVEAEQLVLQGQVLGPQRVLALPKVLLLLGEASLLVV